VSDISYLDLIDRHTPGPRDDVSPLFANGEAFAAAVSDLATRCESLRFDVIAAIDALGFALGAALAFRAGCGLILVRKAEKLPVRALRETFTDYTGEAKALELRVDLLRVGARVLVVDEWIETGAQVLAAIKLIERAQGAVVGVACIHADDKEGPRILASRYPLISLSGLSS